MPTRIPSHTPPRLRQRRPAADVNRPNAAARGYCNKAWYTLRKQILVRDAWTCQTCGRICSDLREAQVDHIVPKSAGGGDTPENLQCLCLRCHARKGIHERRPLP
jgi:5-methylcytosine-specific restriction protein A